MKLRIEMHDSVIGSLKKDADWLEIQFKSFVILDIKDQFGFNFVTSPCREGSIKLVNPEYDSLPTPGPIAGGRVDLGDLAYNNCLPLDLTVKNRCLLVLEQGAEVHKIFADQLYVSVRP
jgi:hypothetical protein